jgi:hypothetical protein
VKGEDMTGESYGERRMFLGEKAFLEGAFGGRRIFLWIFFCGILAGLSSFAFGVNHCRGHRVAGGFGHGGQDSFQYPGAREPDRLLLAGWEVSRFGQSLVSASG